MSTQQLHSIINQEGALVDDVFLKEPVQEDPQFWLGINENSKNSNPS